MGWITFCVLYRLASHVSGGPHGSGGPTSGHNEGPLCPSTRLTCEIYLIVPPAVSHVTGVTSGQWSESSIEDAPHRLVRRAPAGEIWPAAGAAKEPSMPSTR